LGGHAVCRIFNIDAASSDNEEDEEIEFFK
jgi:hypothetical protein